MNIKYRKTIPLSKEYDIIVVGGGPAGICAAASAAREGCRVLLIERLGILGGNLTSGHVSPILGSTSRGTMADELVTLFSEKHKDAREVITRNGKEVHIDHEEAKAILAEFLTKAGVDFRLCTSLADVKMTGGHIDGVIVCSVCGLEYFSGKVFIDATGDGQLAYLAGCEYKIGRDSDGAVQPVTLEFIVDNVDESVAISAWGGSDPVKLPDGKEYRVLCREKNENGELPENVTIVRLHRTFYDGERAVNATQLNGMNTLDSVEVAKAEVELRGQINSVLTFLRKYVAGYENAKIKSSASVLGVRETRRIMGRYVLNDADVETGAKFDDAVVHDAWFLIDIHNPSGGGQAEGHSHMAKPYDIPYRCLLPNGVNNLLTSGRCISGTHRAHASYRVMNICMATGQAAGIAAAVSVREEILPEDISAEKLRTELIKNGVIL